MLVGKYVAEARLWPRQRVQSSNSSPSIWPDFCLARPRNDPDVVLMMHVGRLHFRSREIAKSQKALLIDIGRYQRQRPVHFRSAISASRRARRTDRPGTPSSSALLTGGASVPIAAAPLPGGSSNSA